MNGKREFGDYQTPAMFAQRVCDYLKNKKKIKPSIIIEPTCGRGSFIKASLAFDAEEIIGIEINEGYCDECRKSFLDDRVTIINADFFGYNLHKHVDGAREVLVIGNPPWVTNSELSALGSNNLPNKTNFKRLNGLDAITGSGNFDICEYMILQIVESLKNENATIAMLCKTSVARNVFVELKRTNICFSECETLEFDASKVFGINASACVLVIKLAKDEVSPDICHVYDFDNGIMERPSFGFIDNNFYSNIEQDALNYEGKSEFEWRQGVKHDCSKIMELRLEDNNYINGRNEIVDLEDTIVFPLIKSSMFKKPLINQFDRYVIVTQKKAREDTSALEQLVPKTWDYLNANKSAFDNRRSSIYRGAPAFSMFGVGDYSYSKYKVGVSGFYKKPLFSVLYTDSGKPVMTDDTSYFICFEEYEMAYVAMLVLNSNKVQSFLKSIAFLDSKRPYTKKVLGRISFKKVMQDVTYSDLKSTEKVLDLDSYLTLDMLDRFILLSPLQ